MKKKLYRSEKNRKLAGVCGGVAEYFNLDATLIRLGIALLTCFWATGLIVYIVAAFVIPTESEVATGDE